MMRDKFIFHPFWVTTVLPKRAIKNAGFSLGKKRKVTASLNEIKL